MTTSSQISIRPFDGFRNFNTHHCVTGSMRHVYEHNHHPISEDMLLGLGEGVGFIYWHQKDQVPFFGGRCNPKPSLEELAGRRTGVEIIPHTTTSQKKARVTLIEMLEANHPVMLQVDMGFLPYFDFSGADYHFGGHAIVACGYDPQTDRILVADRDGLYEVPMADLAKSRNSTYKPFPPKNRWYSFDFTNKRTPTQGEIYESIHKQAKLMLEPPISNLGVTGIRKTARMIPQWPQILSEEHLRWALFNGYIFTSPAGGTGGGCFRYMFSRFLAEGAVISENNRLAESARDFQLIGDRWEALGRWFKHASKHSEPASIIHECVVPLNQLADLEEVAWEKLLHM